MPDDAMPHTPTWGVVMPFYRNEATIDACLRSFMEQSFPPAEIIVTDDGSLGPEALQALQARWPKPVSIASRLHGGQSASTNDAIRRAQSDFLLLTCADIIAPRELLALHRDAHAQRADRVAVMGPLPYAESVPMTPLMRHLATPGVQFCFNAMTDVEHVDPMHCYAPNLSVARADLMAIGLFDASFTYGMQDVDLGHRLGQSGVRFVLEPRAHAWHAQGSTLEGYLRRQRRVGQAHVRWLEKHADAAMAGRLAGHLHAARAYGKPFDTLLTEALAAYAPFADMTHPPALLCERLFAAFHLWFGLALGIGVLEQPERLRALTALYSGLRRGNPMRPHG